VDGKAEEIAVTEPHGQISVEVPAGEHRLEVWFGTTSVRTVATLISLASVVGLMACALYLAWWGHGGKEGRQVG
jgi:hypothetical protein